MTDLAHVASALVTRGKGILAADERVGTITNPLELYKIESTAISRREFRELLLTTPGVEEFISGVIMHDETIRQQTSSGEPFPQLCARIGIVSGIKVDSGAKQLALHEHEYVTEGLDGLRHRLAEYRRLGAQFAKWRAVIEISDTTPSPMHGPHTIERCEQVTSAVLRAVFAALCEERVFVEEMLLKPNMVIHGDESRQQASLAEVATSTLRVLRGHAPAAVPGIVFLSGGQHDVEATRHLDAINRAPGPKPWRQTFSFARALQDAPLAVWRGMRENVPAAQRAFYHRARCNGLASVGAYTSFEEEHVAEPVAHAGWH